MEVYDLYNRSIMFYAIKASISHLAWLTIVIAAPAMLLKDGLSLTEKVFIVGIVFLVIWAVYFSLCWIFHRRSLKDVAHRTSYLKLSNEEKGKEIGLWFEGW